MPASGGAESRRRASEAWLRDGIDRRGTVVPAMLQIIDTPGRLDSVSEAWLVEFS